MAADATHSHAGDERASYYLDQLFVIGVCAAVAGVTVVLWRSSILIDLLHPKFNLFVGAGGIALLAIVAFRAVAVWREVDDKPAKPADCGHTHGHAEDCGHSHGEPKSEHVATPGAMSLSLAPAAPHSHGHGNGHAHAHDHDHGGAPWRYILLLLPVVLYFLVLSQPTFSFRLEDSPSSPVAYIRNFITIFASILWEALPFIILGALLAGILEEFLPQSVITAVIPKNPFVAICMGGLLGLVFPMCECGIVPIMRRLLRKGLPLSCCIAYLLAGPIVNVVVLLSTVAAFSGMENTFVAGEPSYQMESLWMTLFRGGMGYLVAVVTGGIVHWQHGKHGDALLTALARPTGAVTDEAAKRGPIFERLGNVSETSLHDFVDITVFLILGALLSATVRIFLGPEEIGALGSNHAILAIVLMMGLAIVLCLCSEADAFVAASFVALRPSAKLAFLVLGPMLDFKLYAMYTRIFRPRLILIIYASVISQVFVYSVAAHYFWEANAPRLISPKKPAPIAMTVEDMDVMWEEMRADFFDSVGIPVPRGPEKPRVITFYQLEAAINNPQARSYLEGKLVTMSGQFSGNEKRFTLLRYKRNCCAADATPLKATVYVKEKAKFNVTPYLGQWVSVTGRLSFDGPQAKILLEPAEGQKITDLIEIIDKPVNPYLD